MFPSRTTPQTVASTGETHAKYVQGFEGCSERVWLAPLLHAKLIAPVRSGPLRPIASSCGIQEESAKLNILLSFV